MTLTHLPGTSDAPDRPIRVAVLVETRFYREGLSTGLAAISDLSVVGRGSGWSDALPLIRRESPDVVLLDLAIARYRDALRALASVAPQMAVIALSVEDSADHVVPLAEAGIAGYVTPDQSLAEVADVIVSVARNEMPCSPSVASGLLRRVGALASDAPPSAPLLTPREHEIVALVARGLSNREIGDRLVIELSTVKNHVHNILDKLQVSSRAEAVALLRSAPAPAASGLA